MEGLKSYYDMSETLMTVIIARGETASPTDTINLTATFYNQFGMPTNTDSVPQISLVAPSGQVMMPFTSAGVSQVDIGKYLFQYTVPINPAYGVYNDLWQASINEVVSTQTLSFIVSYTEYASTFSNSDGYRALGDWAGFTYSQHAIGNINKLLKTLQTRIYNNAKAQSTDSFGNVTYVDCSIFGIEQLTVMLANAMSDFNQVPYLTFFTFEDDWFVNEFHAILVEGATLMALSSQALIERGKEFAITDNGVNFVPPTVSELLNTEYSTLLTHYWDKLKYIKASLRPFPRGLGTFSMLSATNPQVTRLRHLRARQIL